MENLTKKVKFDNIISYQTEGQTEEKKDKMQLAKEKFEDSIKVNLSKIPQIPQKVKKTLVLCKDKMSYIGHNVKDKIVKILNIKQSEKQQEDVDFER